ncbi:MAG: porin family protein [Microscillaceae bacterium]|jgi:opacity protein-like surface antigen|nr:porin family protein [Microscillaceae bacterium]
MKKTAFIILAMVVFDWANAQIEKGSMYLGGSFGISSTTIQTNNNDRKVSSFSLVPNFGYFVTDKISVGLGIGYEQSRNDLIPGVGTATDTRGLFIIAPAARYYVPLTSENFFFFAQFQVGFGFGNRKFEDRVGSATFTVESKSRSFGLGLSPGFAFFPTKKWAIELSFEGISYRSFDPNTDSNSDNDRESTFTLGVDSFAPRLGVQFFF